MSQMIAIGILFCLIFVNCFGGIDGVGEEANDGNGKKDLLFEEMWRKAFEANRHNGKEGEEKEMAKKVKEEQKEEEDEEEEEEERDGEKWKKTIKKEAKIEENEWEDLVSKSETKENDQRQDNNSASDQNDMNQSARQMKAEEKWEIIEKFDNMRKECKMKGDYKSEDPCKIEQKIAKALGVSRVNIYKWKRKLNQRKKPENEESEKSDEEKFEIIEKFNRIRKERTNKKGYTKKMCRKIEREIAKEMGTNIRNIYRWKKEQSQKKGPENGESEEEKWKIIKKFNKMRKANRNKYKNESHAQIERGIARELGTYRAKIYAWKKKFANSNPPKKCINEQKGQIIESSSATESEEKKMKIIEKFDRMRKEYQMKKDYKKEDRNKIEKEITKELGISRRNIYKWKKEQSQRKEPENEESEESEEEKFEIIEKFDRMRKEYQMKKDYKREDRNKMEEETAKALGISRRTIYKWKKELMQRNEPENEERKERLGTNRANIYEWKKTLTPSRVLYTKGQKRAIVAKFDDLCEEFSNKFNRKPTIIIEKKIAKKFNINHTRIYMWKKAFEKDEA